MNRYYMTSETRQALIAESNRLLALRASLAAARKASAAIEGGESGWLDAQGGTETVAADLDSAFARLVADLQAMPSGALHVEARRIA